MMYSQKLLEPPPPQLEQLEPPLLQLEQLEPLELLDFGGWYSRLTFRSFAVATAAIATVPD